MAWTVNNNLEIYLCQTGSLRGALSGGAVKFYTAASALVASCAIPSTTAPGDGTTVFTPTPTSSGSGGTMTNATITDTNGNVLASTDSVGTSTEDIVFDNNVVAAGGSVAPGAITLSLANLTLTKV